ncbi:MAG: hypothetical protein Q8O89_02310 [Nanoarchaeota archaeon]|nr:hypothetical protein [Nanoarchaeota archaeon]
MAKKELRDNVFLGASILIIIAFFAAIFTIDYRLGFPQNKMTGFAVDELNQTIDDVTDPTVLAAEEPALTDGTTVDETLGIATTASEETGLDTTNENTAVEETAAAPFTEEQTTATPVTETEQVVLEEKQVIEEKPSLIESVPVFVYLAAIGFFVLLIATLLILFVFKPKQRNKEKQIGNQNAFNQNMNFNQNNINQNMNQNRNLGVNNQNMQMQQPNQNQIDPAISSYVNQMRTSGYDSMQIRQQLISSGWQQWQIEDLFRKMGFQ